MCTLLLCIVWVTVPTTMYVPTMQQYRIRRTILIRTCDQHKNLYITLFLLAIFGPDYCVPGTSVILTFCPVTDCTEYKESLVVTRLCYTISILRFFQYIWTSSIPQQELRGVFHGICRSASPCVSVGMHLGMTQQQFFYIIRRHTY